MPSVRTIWFFHSGMVLRTEVWIFSTSAVSLFWIMRICGAVCSEIMRVSSRSWSFFFKPDALVLKVVGRLRILGQVRGFGLFAQLAQGGAAGLGQLLLAGEDIHGQLLEILQIPVIHLIHDGHVLQKA